MANTSNQKKLKKADYILFAVVIFIAAAFVIMFKISNKTNKYIKVQIGNDSSYFYDLSEDMNKVIYMDDDKGNKCYNELVIENGQAYIKSADCYNQICVNSNAISKNGESIVCLPHKLAVSVVNADTNLR